MKFCCKPSFQLWLQQKYEKLLLTPNGHFHCAKKASEQDPLLLYKYLLGALLAQKLIIRRKDVHQMPLLVCYLQSWQLAMGSKCLFAQLHGLTSYRLESFRRLVSLWLLKNLKQNWWSSQPQNNPLMIRLYNYQLIFSLSLLSLVCSRLGKNRFLTKLLLETNMSSEIKPFVTSTPTFLTLITQL